MHGHVRAARRECAFAGQRRRQPRRGCRRPRLAAIGGEENRERAVDRVADDDAVRGVPEGHGIEEALRLRVGVLQRPRRARIHRLVDPRCRAGADAQQIRRARIDRVHVTEVETFGRDREGLPRPTAVCGSEHGAATAACPGDGVAHRTHTAQRRGHAACQGRPPWRNKARQCSTESDREQGYGGNSAAHGQILAGRYFQTLLEDARAGGVDDRHRQRLRFRIGFEHSEKLQCRRPAGDWVSNRPACR